MDIYYLGWKKAKEANLGQFEMLIMYDNEDENEQSVANITKIVKEQISNGLYSKIGSLPESDPEKAYYRCQNLDEDQMNPFKKRSMSIGDLAVDPIAKKVWLCASLGFTELKYSDIF